MRILFLTTYFPRPRKHQIGTWALQQAMALARVCDLRVVCCTSYVPEILGIIPRARPWADIPLTHQWDNVPARYLKALYYPIQPFKRWAYPNPERQMRIAWNSIRRRLLSEVREFSPEVIYVHHTSASGYFAERIHRATGVPYVVTDHDFNEICDCARLPRRKAMFERIIRAASRNVCVAKRMQADMMRIFPFARAVTLYNGINPHPPEIFAVPRPPELAGKQVIFSAGMFNVRKGFPLLIEAFAKIAGKFPDAVLRIAGDGVQRAVIEQTIAAHRVEARVQLLGLMPQARIFQEMAWSDAFALVGWDEPFATVFIEAMGAGKPILTAGDGGINDVVVDRVHGLVVPPKNADAAAEALASLLADSQARETMGRNARTLVENRLTWDANARELLKLFTEAAPPPGSA